MSGWLIGGAVLLHAWSVWNFVGILDNLRPGHPDPALRIFTFTKLFSSSDNFTPRGKTILRRSRVLALLAATLLILAAYVD